MYASQSSIDHGVMSVLGEELIREPPSAKDEAMQAIWRVTAADTGSLRVATTRGVQAVIILSALALLLLLLRVHPHPLTGAPLGTRNHIVHRILLIACHSKPIVPQVLGADLILLIPTC